MSDNKVGVSERGGKTSLICSMSDCCHPHQGIWELWRVAQTTGACYRVGGGLCEDGRHRIDVLRRTALFEAVCFDDLPSILSLPCAPEARPA